MSNVIVDIKKWFVQAVPSPTAHNINAQTGCHFEEVAEMLEEMKGTDTHTDCLITAALTSVRDLANHLKSPQPEPKVYVRNPVKFLDSLCDQVVTAVGVGHMYDYRVVSALHEVNASNQSKFVDGKPVFDENRKIIKGPNYFVANLTPFV